MADRTTSMYAVAFAAGGAAAVSLSVWWLHRTKKENKKSPRRCYEMQGKEEEEVVLDADDAWEHASMHPAVSMHSLAGSVLQHVAVLVVDCQPVYWDDQPAIRATNPRLPQNVQTLLGEARDLLSPPQIVHIRANYTFKFAQNFKLLNPDKPMPSDIEACAWASSKVGEQIIVKPCFDSFHHTSLEKYLNDLQVTDLVVCGLLTSCCVLFTAQSAFASGFRVRLISDACSDRTPDRHAQTLSHYGSYCFEVIDDLSAAFTGIYQNQYQRSPRLSAPPSPFLPHRPVSLNSDPAADD